MIGLIWQKCDQSDERREAAEAGGKNLEKSPKFIAMVNEAITIRDVKELPDEQKPKGKPSGGK